MEQPLALMIEEPSVDKASSFTTTPEASKQTVTLLKLTRMAYLVMNYSPTRVNPASSLLKVDYRFSLH